MLGVVVSTQYMIVVQHGFGDAPHPTDTTVPWLDVG